MSVVRQIYTNIAASPVAFTTEAGDAVSVAAWDLHQIRPRVAQADLPARLLYPMGPYSAASPSEYVAIGTGSTVKWRILDDMLWLPATSGNAIWDVMPDLVRYAGAYADMIALMRQPVPGAVAGSRTTLEGWDIAPALIQWGETSYFGVRVSLTVQELKFA